MDNNLELEKKLKQQAIEAAVKYYEVKHTKEKNSNDRNNHEKIFLPDARVFHQKPY